MTLFGHEPQLPVMSLNTADTSVVGVRVEGEVKREREDKASSTSSSISITSFKRTYTSRSAFTERLMTWRASISASITCKGLADRI